MTNAGMISIIAHGIAEAQGDAYAEYASEFDGYAKAALDALKKHSAGLSVGGVNVWGSPDDIKSVMDWQQSHAVVEDLRTHVRHWREGYGKLAEIRTLAVRLTEMWEFPGWELGEDSAYEHEFIRRIQALAEAVRLGGHMKPGDGAHPNQMGP